MIIQLELFSNNQSATDPSDLGGTQGEVTNPCISCTLRGLCDSDDCGAHGYPLDTPSTRFSNLGEYINFLKHYDWL